MARIRTIKPEFWKNEALSELPEATHILAAALLNYADDFGYFNANPRLVESECSPLRAPSVSIPESLRSLQTIGYIRLGIGDDGKRYGQVVEFSTHQRVSHPSPTKIGDKSIIWDVSGINPEPLQSPRESLRPEQGTGNRELNREQGTGKPAASPPVLLTVVTGKDLQLQPEIPTFLLRPPPKASAPDLPDWIPPDAWAGFVEMRKKIRQPLTERGALLIIAALKKLRATEDIGAVLDQSTMKNYRGVFPVKHDGNSYGQRSNPPSAHDKLNAGAALFIASLGGDDEQGGPGQADSDADGPRFPLLAS